MKGSLRRYCGCRGDDGRQLGSRCPRLSSPSHGRWSYQVDLPPMDDKRRQTRKGGFPTKKAAQAAMTAKLAELGSGNYRDDEKQTLGDYLPAWLERKIEDGLRPTTASSYRTYITADIAPALGRHRLSALSPVHVDTFLRALRREGRGAATIVRIRAVLRSALSDAKRSRLVAFNAAVDVAVPVAVRPEVSPWEPSEVAAFLDHVADHRLGALFEVLTFTGLRRGEALALRWQDVDLETGVIVVRSNLTEIRGTTVEGAPKTRKGQRRVDIGDRTIGALRAHRARQARERLRLGDGWEGTTDRVFTNPVGADLRPSYATWLFRHLIGQVTVPTAPGAGEERQPLRRVRLHDLRHGAASLMLAAGADMAVVSKRLGHSQLAVTVDVYSHLVDGVGRRTADAAESLVSRGPVRGNRVATSGGSGR